MKYMLINTGLGEPFIYKQESVRVVGVVSSSGENTIIEAPGTGKALRILSWKFFATTDAETDVILKSATTSIDYYMVTTKGSGLTDESHEHEFITLGENEPLLLDLSAANAIGYAVRAIVVPC